MAIGQERNCRMGAEDDLGFLGIVSLLNDRQVPPLVAVTVQSSPFLGAEKIMKFLARWYFASPICSIGRTISLR